MRGLPYFNFDNFLDAAFVLEQAGYTVVNPAQRDLDMGFDPFAGNMTGHENLADLGFDLSEALAWDLDQVAKADGVALLPDWDDSNGARAEFYTAKALGKDAMTVQDWLETAKAKTLLDSTPDETLIEQIHNHMRIVADSAGENQRSIMVEDRPFKSQGFDRDGDEVLTLSSFQGPVKEVRITSETGGQKGQKRARLGSVDPLALLTLAEVSGFGAEKYAAFNFLKGYDWDLSYDALQRHAMAFWNGEENDPESGLPHITHAAWHALCLTSFLLRGLGTDTRYKGQAA